MRIAFFTDTFLPQINGVAKTLSKFVDYMERNDIEYKIFAPSFKEQEFYDNVIRSKSFKFVLYPQCRLSVPNYFAISKQLDDFNPDIVHVVTEFNMGLCGLKYARSRNLPLVSSYETNISQYLEYYNLKFLESPSWKYFKWFHNKCDINFCPSIATVDLLKEQGFGNPKLWERGIETDKFSPELKDPSFKKSINAEGKLVFLYVGRVSPEKDLEIFVNVAKRLNEKYYDKIHFVMIGDGPSLKDLKEMAPDNITFTGFLTGDSLTKAYASSDVFLFPSPTETLGFVILEAMSSGLAIISCNAGGISDNLMDGYNGIACREKQEDDYYNAAEKIINDDNLRTTLAANARNFALTKDWDRTFDGLVKDYEELLLAKPTMAREQCS